MNVRIPSHPGAPNPAMAIPKIRQVYAGKPHDVIDIIRGKHTALVVCVSCGSTWAEGAEILQPCQGARR